MSSAIPDREHHARLERMYLAAPINRFYEPTIRVTDGEAEIVKPVREPLFHAAGAVHGSVVFKLLDDAAFFAVGSRVHDVFVLTVSFHVHFTRPVSEGTVTGRGRVVHASRRLFVAEAVAMDAGGREIGRGSGSFMRSTIELTEEMGYR